MPAFDCRPGRVIDQLDRAAGREQTAIIQEFEQRPAAQSGSLVFFPGPSHETSLPRRPPCHWRWPPRESVVIALLPWRSRTGGRLGSGPTDPDAGSPPRSTIEASPSERKQWLFETDHLKAQGRCEIAVRLSCAIESLACGRIARVRRTDGPWKRLAGIWGTSPALLRGDGDSDLTSCVRPGGVVPPDPCGLEAGLAEPSPSRFQSRRSFRSQPRSLAGKPVPIEPGTTASHSALCPVMRAPRVRARRTEPGRARVSISASCIGPAHGSYSLESWKSSA